MDDHIPMSEGPGEAGAASGGNEPVGCAFCGSVPSSRAAFKRQVGMIFRRRVQSIDTDLCRDCGTALFRSMTNRTLLTGWWGLASFFTNWGHLFNNWRGRRAVARLAVPSPGPRSQLAPIPTPMDPGKPLLQRLGLWFVAGLLTAAVVAGIAAELSQASRNSSGSLARAGELDVTDLRVGDCFNDPSTGVIDGIDGAEIADVRAVPCAHLHDNEVFHVGRFPQGSGATFPGGNQLFEQAATVCLDHFYGFVGEPYETSKLDITVITPTRESWSFDDRGLTCAAYDLGGPVTGSLAGVRR